MGIPGLILLVVLALALVGIAIVAVLSGALLRLLALRRPALKIRWPEAVTFAALVGAGVLKLLFMVVLEGRGELLLLQVATTPLVLAYLSCALAYRLSFASEKDQPMLARSRWDQAASLALLPAAMFAVPLLLFFVLAGAV